MITQNSPEEPPQLTLIDFNVARHFKDPETKNGLLMLTNTGFPAFCAPEIFSGASYT
jgi:serine/threonine protein kinase